MIKGTTKSGFKYEVDASAADNMELIDALAEAAGDDMLAISNVCKMLLGKDMRKKLYDHVRAADGRVPIKNAVDEIMEIMQAMGDKGKK